MCSRATCKSCGKATYRGCGMHVEQVLGGVPQADRCACDGKGPGAGAGSGLTSEGLFSRLFGRRG